MLYKPLHNDSASKFHNYKLYPICHLHSSYTKNIYKHKALSFKVSKAAQLSRAYVWVMDSPVDINVLPENHEKLFVGCQVNKACWSYTVTSIPQGVIFSPEHT